MRLVHAAPASRTEAEHAERSEARAQSEALVSPRHLHGRAPALLLDGGPLGYIPGARFAHLCNGGVARGTCTITSEGIGAGDPYVWLRDEAGYRFSETIAALSNRCLWRPLQRDSALGYTPGAGGALDPVASALNSLPSCPCRVWPYRVGPCGDRCGAPARAVGDGSLRCAAGHVYESTPGEIEQARAALAADDDSACVT